MPISPTPPSGAKTSSSDESTMISASHGGGGRPNGKSPSGRDRLEPSVRQPQHQPTSIVERLEAAGELPRAEPHPQLAAERALQPCGADRRKAFLPFPQAANHRDRQRREQ